MTTLNTMLWGPIPKRRNRTHHRKPLAIWKERMARMRHRAQFRRWRVKPVTRKVYEETKAALAAGMVNSYVGFVMLKVPIVAHAHE